MNHNSSQSSLRRGTGDGWISWQDLGDGSYSDGGDGSGGGGGGGVRGAVSRTDCRGEASDGYAEMLASS